MKKRKTNHLLLLVRLVAIAPNIFEGAVPNPNLMPMTIEQPNPSATNSNLTRKPGPATRTRKTQKAPVKDNKGDVTANEPYSPKPATPLTRGPEQPSTRCSNRKQPNDKATRDRPTIQQNRADTPNLNFDQNCANATTASKQLLLTDTNDHYRSDPMETRTTDSKSWEHALALVRAKYSESEKKAAATNLEQLLQRTITTIITAGCLHLWISADQLTTSATAQPRDIYDKAMKLVQHMNELIETIDAKDYDTLLIARETAYRFEARSHKDAQALTQKISIQLQSNPTAEGRLNLFQEMKRIVKRANKCLKSTIGLIKTCGAETEPTDPLAKELDELCWIAYERNWVDRNLRPQRPKCGLDEPNRSIRYLYEDNHTNNGTKYLHEARVADLDRLAKIETLRNGQHMLACYPPKNCAHVTKHEPDINAMRMRWLKTYIDNVIASTDYRLDYRPQCVIDDMARLCRQYDCTFETNADRSPLERFATFECELELLRCLAPIQNHQWGRLRPPDQEKLNGTRLKLGYIWDVYSDLDPTQIDYKERRKKWIKLITVCAVLSRSDDLTSPRFWNYDQKFKIYHEDYRSIFYHDPKPTPNPTPKPKPNPQPDSTLAANHLNAGMIGLGPKTNRIRVETEKKPTEDECWREERRNYWEKKFTICLQPT
jgi:hypothetical protein